MYYNILHVCNYLRIQDVKAKRPKLSSKAAKTELAIWNPGDQLMDVWVRHTRWMVQRNPNHQLKTVVNIPLSI